MHKAIAVISDIHSNLEALEAVLADLKSQEVSEIVCLGDIVGYASGVKSCMRVVQELDCPVVMGNHDEAACLPSPPDDFNEAARFGAQFSARRLTAMDRSWLSTLPRNVEIDGVLFTHASLESPSLWNYILSRDDARRHFAHQTTHLAFCGHTHTPVMWFQASPDGHVIEYAGKDQLAFPSMARFWLMWDRLVNHGMVITVPAMSFIIRIRGALNFVVWTTTLSAQRKRSYGLGFHGFQHKDFPWGDNL